MLLLFDIDGTLVHSAGAGRAAIEGAMHAVYGTAGPIDELRFDGLTDPQIVRTLLRAVAWEDEAIDAGLGAVWAEYEGRLVEELAARREEVRPAEGVPALLDLLVARGATLGLVTGNIATGAEHKLAACGLGGRFGFGAFGSDAEDRDALPPIAVARATERTGLRFEPRETWVIGDTPRDVACARAAGVRALAVATGRYSVEELTATGADGVEASLVDADGVLSRLGADARADGRRRGDCG